MIGRKMEQEELLRRYQRNRTEFIAVYRELLRRQEILLEKVSPKMSVYQTLITTYGLNRNEYSSVFTQTVSMDDLFSE